jgi:excisionase family DNA binding protein
MQDHPADRDEPIANRHATAGSSGNGRLLTILEAAAMLGISRSSIYRLFGAGELCWVRVCAVGDGSRPRRSIDSSTLIPKPLRDALARDQEPPLWLSGRGWS